jgi:lysophospholipase L1-like esterase
MMNRVVLFAIAGLVAVLMPGSVSALPNTFREPTIAVMGGTMVARYSDEPGSRSQGWWSIAAQRLGARVVAVSGEVESTISSRGLRCQGTTLGQRLKYLPAADALLIEVDTETFRTCTGPGKRKRLSAKQRRAEISAFARSLARRVDHLGIDRHRVYLVTPTSPGASPKTRDVRSDVKRLAARAHGFTMVPAVRLTSASTYRDSYPNRAGNRKIAARVVSSVRSLPKRAVPKVKKSSKRGPSVTVYGTSLTSFFSDEPGSPVQGWWSMAARRLKASSLRVSAEGGSGALVRGNKCSGTTFGERLKYLRYSDILIIEVGRNDARRCRDNYSVVSVTHDYQREKITEYVQQVADRTRELGIAASSVYFMTPWDTYYWGLRTRLQGMIRDAVAAQGFTYIETPLLREHLTIDGSHPNRDGNRLLSDVVVKAVRRS